MAEPLPSSALKLQTLLSPARVLCDVSASSKKKVLETIAKTLSANLGQLHEDKLFERFVQREKLGSTAIGHGCAIPHCRAEGIEDIYGCFAKISQTVDFDSPDQAGVDLVFAIVVPEEAVELHLNALGYIADLFHNDQLRQQMRRAKSSDELYRLLT